MDPFQARGDEGAPMSRVAKRCWCYRRPLCTGISSRRRSCTSRLSGTPMSRSAMSSWRARSGDPVDQRLRRFIRVFVKLQLGDPNLTYGSRQLRDGLPDKRTEVEAIQETTPATADRDPSRWPRAGCVQLHRPRLHDDGTDDDVNVRARFHVVPARWSTVGQRGGRSLRETRQTAGRRPAGAGRLTPIGALQRALRDQLTNSSTVGRSAAE